MDFLEVPGARTALANVAHAPHFFRNHQRFYRPEFDEIVRDLTGLDAKSKTLLNQVQNQMALKIHLEESVEEPIRRVARCKLVEFARLIWDGQDPMPNKICCSLSGDLLRSEPREGMPDEATFRGFRERFAPTYKLEEFLFPAYSLDDRPTQLPYQPCEWLEDPTLIFTKDNPAVENDQWYVAKALEMLKALSG